MPGAAARPSSGAHPRVADAGIRGGWAGLYEMTPDHNAIIGEATSVSRFLYATGFSGHGFLQGPATGEMLRDLSCDRAPFVDIGPLSGPLRRQRPAARTQHRLMPDLQTAVRAPAPIPSNVVVVAEALREAIVLGRLRPGERIKENPLAEQLGMSRAPIRDALRLLEHEGLVREHPQPRRDRP